MDKIKLSANILFSGIGCQERGFLDSELFDLDIVTTSDIDKEAILIYAVLHCGLNKRMINNFLCPSIDKMIYDLERMNIGYDVKKQKPYNWQARRNQEEYIKKYWLACYFSKNKGDISRINHLAYADLWSVSFPCQSISVAGKMKGFRPDSGTRSSLLWENIRLLKDAVDNNRSPKYIMFENVKNLVGKEFKNDFDILLSILDDLGYNSYWDILNAKECGIPQNRERVFVLCFRKDIDNKNFKFPFPFDKGIRLHDVLEEKPVAQNYYIGKKQNDHLVAKMIEDGTLQKL